MNVTEQRWHDYERTVLAPMGLSPETLRTLKNVFYSGTLYAVDRLVVASYAEEPQAARAVFTELCNDLKTWKQDLAAAALREEAGGRLQ